MTEADLDPRIITALGHWTYGVDTQEAFPDWDAAADLRARVLRGDCELHSLYLLMDGLVKAEREENIKLRGALQECKQRIFGTPGEKGTLGALHCIAAAATVCRNFPDDPNLKIETRLHQIIEWREEAHGLLVAAARAIDAAMPERPNGK